MTPDRLQLEDAKRWLAIARSDLRAAEILAAAGSYSLALFHCLRAAEKTLKGFLTRHGKPFPKTHDISDFSAQCLEIDPSLHAILTKAEPSRSMPGAFAIRALRLNQTPRMPPKPSIRRVRCSNAWERC